jgi:threonine dehydrogenase-like Zn-dependent dehydrogenase
MDISKKYGGADYTINYTKKGWQDEVKKLTGGKGVDVVYDPVGLIRGTHSQTSLLGSIPDGLRRLLKVYCLEGKSLSRRICRRTVREGKHGQHLHLR